MGADEDLYVSLGLDMARFQGQMADSLEQIKQYASNFQRNTRSMGDAATESNKKVEESSYKVGMACDIQSKRLMTAKQVTELYKQASLDAAYEAMRMSIWLDRVGNVAQRVGTTLAECSTAPLRADLAQTSERIKNYEYSIMEIQRASELQVEGMTTQQKARIADLSRYKEDTIRQMDAEKKKIDEQKASYDKWTEGINSVKNGLAGMPPEITAVIVTTASMISTTTDVIRTMSQLRLAYNFIKDSKYAMAIANGIEAASQYVLTAAQWAYNVSLYGCPIVWIIAIIMALILIIVALATNLGGCRDAIANWGKGAAEWFGNSGASIQKWGGDVRDTLAKGAGDFNSWCGKTGNDIQKWGADTGSKIQQTSDNIRNGIANSLGNFRNSVGNFFGNIGDAFGDIINQAREWGAKLMRSFVDGMNSMKNSIAKSLGDFGQQCKDFLGIKSPAKEGPLRELMDWGPNLVKTYSQGIKSTLPELQNAVYAMANVAYAPVSTPASVVTNNVENKTYTISPSMNINGAGYNLDDPRLAKALVDTIAREMRRLSEAS